MHEDDLTDEGFTAQIDAMLDLLEKHLRSLSHAEALDKVRALVGEDVLGPWLSESTEAPTPSDLARLAWEESSSAEFTALVMDLEQDLKPIEEEVPEDDYKGGKGWIVIAVGIGRACVLDVDGKLGAGRWFLYEQSLYDPEDEWGLPIPGDPGIYKGTVEAWTTKPGNGLEDYDMGFNLVGEWTDLLPRGVEKEFDWRMAAYSDATLEQIVAAAQAEIDGRKETADDAARSGP